MQPARLLTIFLMLGLLPACDHQPGVKKESKLPDVVPADNQSELLKHVSSESDVMTVELNDESSARLRDDSKKEEAYEPVAPSEFEFELRSFYYEGVVATDGVKPVNGGLGKFLCGGKEIELASEKFEDGHIATKSFGRIRIRFLNSVTRTGFAVFLKPSQKRALRDFCPS